MANMAVAMFEATNALSHRYVSFIGLPDAREMAAADAAAAANEAARLTLTQAFPLARGRINAFAAAHDGPAPVPAREAGHKLGKLAADAVLRRAVMDPSRQMVPYRPETTAGHWVPTALPTLPPFLAAKRAWIVDADALMPPPPPTPDSAAFARDFEETRQWGARDSTLRTAEQTSAAQFWSRYSESPALREDEAKLQGLDAQCRFYAMVAVTDSDTGLVVTRSKFHYMRWRPVTAIRLGDITGNPSLKRDPDWLPLLRTPLHPEYPCGHCTWGAALGTLLASVPGVTAETRFTFSSEALPQNPTRLVTLAEYREVVSVGRIWGGVHFRSSKDAGDKLGAALAAEVLAKFAPLRP